MGLQVSTGSPPHDRFLLVSQFHPNFLRSSLPFFSVVCASSEVPVWLLPDGRLRPVSLSRPDHYGGALFASSAACEGPAVRAW